VTWPDLTADAPIEDLALAELAYESVAGADVPWSWTVLVGRCSCDDCRRLHGLVARRLPVRWGWQ